METCRDCTFKGLGCLFKSDHIEKITHEERDRLFKTMLERHNNARTPPTSVKKKQKPYEETLLTLGVSLMLCLLCFPMAYIGQLFQVFTEFFFNLIGLFIGDDDQWIGRTIPYESTFFYASYWDRCLYWFSLILALFVSVFEHDNSKRRPLNKLDVALCVFAIGLYVVVSLLNINLFLSTFIGAPFLLFCFFITAKR